jgi:hypothetical protein
MKKLIMMLMVVVALSGCGSTAGTGSEAVETEGVNSPSVPEAGFQQDVVDVTDVQVQAELVLTGHSGLLITTDSARVVVAKDDVVVFDQVVHLDAAAFALGGAFSEAGTYSVAIALEEVRGTSHYHYFWSSANMSVESSDDIVLGDIQLQEGSFFQAWFHFTPESAHYTYTLDVFGGGKALSVIHGSLLFPVGSDRVLVLAMLPSGVYDLDFTFHSDGGDYVPVHVEDATVQFGSNIAETFEVIRN